MTRAFSLLEAVAVTLVLALAVPPLAVWLVSATDDRADTVSTAQATILASAVLETVMADAASTDPTLNVASLNDSAAYLNAPGTGLRARLGTGSGAARSGGSGA